jgi:hypothetical protein
MCSWWQKSITRRETSIWRLARLAVLGSRSPVQIAAAALDYGLSAGYSPLDIALLQELATDLQSWESASGGEGP